MIPIVTTTMPSLSMRFARAKNLLIIALFVIIGCVAPALSWAAQGIFNSAGLGECFQNGSCAIDDILKLINSIIKFSAGISGALALLTYVIGGVWMIFSSGNQARAQRGKEIVIGTTVALIFILGSWLIVDFVLRAIQSDILPSDLGVPEQTRSAVTAESCGDLSALAAENNVPYPRKNAPALDRAITCALSDANVRAKVDTEQIYTYELNNDACNYTRGAELCGPCEHTVNSCHYGGATGTEGALAVDFNARSGVSEDSLFTDINRIRVLCGFQYVELEGDHTHASVAGGGCY